VSKWIVWLDWLFVVLTVANINVTPVCRAQTNSYIIVVYCNKKFVINTVRTIVGQCATIVFDCLCPIVYPTAWQFQRTTFKLNWTRFCVNDKDFCDCLLFSIISADFCFQVPGQTSHDDIAPPVMKSVLYLGVIISLLLAVWITATLNSQTVPAWLFAWLFLYSPSCSHG